MQRDGVNTITAAYDPTTGTVKKGVNGHRTPFASLHATLQGKLNGVGRLEAWSTDNCAEIQAVSKLLTAGSLLANIRVHTRDAGGKFKPPCENCQGWLAPAGDGSFKIRT